MLLTDVNLELRWSVCVTLPSPVCSEDSCEDGMSSGEESLSSSLGSDAEGPYFPLRLHKQRLYVP